MIIILFNIIQLYISLTLEISQYYQNIMKKK